VTYTLTDTPKPPSEKDYLPDDAPVPDPPSEPESDTPSMPTYPYIGPDMPGGMPIVPGHPDTPVLPVEPKDPLPNDESADPGDTGRRSVT